MQPHFRTLRESPATALIDADAAMGQRVSVHAMNLAVEKRLASGVAVVSVVNSHHFGGAGSYTRIATDRGLIGMATTATRGIYMVPTFAAEPVLGTNPLAFAAPAGRTGSVRRSPMRRMPGPSSPTGPEGGITPLGGTPEMASYKGYGLAVMAHILGGTLGGASFSPIREQTARSGWRLKPGFTSPRATPASPPSAGPDRTYNAPGGRTRAGRGTTGWTRRDCVDDRA